MECLENLKRQHQEIRTIVSDISSLLNFYILLQDPVPIRNKLPALSGKLSVHLAMEDKSLYPRLIKRGRSEVQITAKVFLAEMGNLINSFQNYSQKWLSADSIKANPDDFINDSNYIFRALLQRINREDRELYPLVEEG